MLKLKLLLNTINDSELKEELSAIRSKYPKTLFFDFAAVNMFNNQVHESIRLIRLEGNYSPLMDDHEQRKKVAQLLKARKCTCTFISRRSKAKSIFSRSILKRYITSYGNCTISMNIR